MYDQQVFAVFGNRAGVCGDTVFLTKDYIACLPYLPQSRQVE